MMFNPMMGGNSMSQLSASMQMQQQMMAIKMKQYEHAMQYQKTLQAQMVNRKRTFNALMTELHSILARINQVQASPVGAGSFGAGTTLEGGIVIPSLRQQ